MPARPAMYCVRLLVRMVGRVPARKGSEVMPAPEEMQRRDEVSRVKAANEEDLLNCRTLPVSLPATRSRTASTPVRSRSSSRSPRKRMSGKATIPKEINGVPTDVIEEMIVPMLLVNAVRLEDLRR